MLSGRARSDLFIRTLFWLAFAALWAYLNKPEVGDFSQFGLVSQACWELASSPAASPCTHGVPACSLMPRQSTFLPL